tara:strand:+ start:12911 stop:14392 length:1482 start_codon:yes stop_codon:yes gene_type:complete
VAQYRFSAQVIKRSDGRSAVAAAAYRAGERLSDERLEMPFDYRARGGVEHTEIMLPEGAPEAFADRSALWNAVEAAEGRSDARVAREVQVSLPHELSAEQRQELVREFVQSAFVDKGMIADVAIHTPDPHGDQRNHHAHIMLTTRTVDEAGFGNKERAWDKREQLAEWREQWAEVQNRHLAKALGPDAPKVSHKSLEDQGLEREATIHLGPTASAIERNGERSERGEINRAVKASNAERAELAKSITSMDDKLAKMLPQRETGIDGIKKELADYDSSLRRQIAGWKAEQKAIPVPPLVKPSDVRREVISDARARLRDAQRDLERTKARTKATAAKRTTLASFLRNPQRAIWAKIVEVHAMDRARRELARARAGVKVREDWLRSEQGRSHILGRVDQATKAAQPAKQQNRNLDRKIRRIEKRLVTVERVRERVEIAEQLGLKSVSRPINARDATQVLRRVDAATQNTLSRVSAQQIQQARAKVQSIKLGRGFTR